MKEKLCSFFLPIWIAKKAERLILKKQHCLKNFDKCNAKTKEEIKQEFKRLPQDLEELKRLLEKEFDRKTIIENKSSALFIVVSLLGISFTFFYRIIETVTNTIFLHILVVFTFVELIYLILAVSSLLYVFVESNIIYVPSSNSVSVDEFKKSVLLNRYQNIIRTNYLSTVYSNIRVYFWLLLAAFEIFFISLILN